MDSLFNMFKRPAESFSQPAYLPGMKKEAWNERLSSMGGYPLPVTEWQSKGNEKHGWVQNKNQPSNAQISQGQCMYTTQGSLFCRK